MALPVQSLVRQCVQHQKYLKTVMKCSTRSQLHSTRPAGEVQGETAGQTEMCADLDVALLQSGDISHEVVGVAHILNIHRQNDGALEVASSLHIGDSCISMQSQHWFMIDMRL